MKLVSLRHAGFNWVVTPGAEEAVRSFQSWSHEQLEADQACRILKKEAKRFAGTIDLGPRRLFLKSQTHARRGFGIPSLFRRSPGRREWDHASYAHSHGIPTAVPIAYAERRQLFGVSQSIFLSELVEHDGTLMDWYEARLTDGPERIPPLIEAAGALLRRLHDIGLLHWDYNPENVLIRRGSAAAPEFMLIDLKSAEIRPDASRCARLENVAKSLFQLRRYEVLAPWRPAGQDAYLRGYFGGTEPAEIRMAELKPHLAKRGRMLFDHIRSDFEGGDHRFGAIRDGALCLRSRRDTARDLSLEMIPPELRSPREFLWAAGGPEGRVVPSTRPGWNLFLRSVEPRPAKAFWLHVLRCLALGLPCVPPLAMVEEEGVVRAIGQVLDAELRPATEAGAGSGDAARRLVDALQVHDFSSERIEPRHLRLRVPRRPHEEPALLLLFPEAAKDGPAMGPDARRTEADRLARLLSDSNGVQRPKS